jgi:hypothetical protein
MTTAASLSVAVPAAQNAGIPRKHIFLLEGDAPGYTTIKDLLEIGDQSGIRGQVLSFQIPQGKTNKDVCGFLSFSSGTTGLPKAVRGIGVLPENSESADMLRVIGHDIAS